jgi:hypothetical protein
LLPFVFNLFEIKEAFGFGYYFLFLIPDKSLYVVTDDIQHLTDIVDHARV